MDKDYDEVVVICGDITLLKKTHRRSKDWKLGPLSGSFMHVESGKLGDDKCTVANQEIFMFISRSNQF